MSDDEIRDALERAADVVLDEDLSHTAWYVGCSRKRRARLRHDGARSAVGGANMSSVAVERDQHQEDNRVLFGQRRFTVGPQVSGS